ncbi:MAG TPA: branched-chain amino acid ABC transporter permease [Syntrophorhabdales bacterium]|nr:branched-chain amino acid ABC transporter permease [Syntrophorhabdales bacterium]
MKGKLAITALLLLMIVTPLVIKSEYLLNLLILICLYAILSHSWNILGGYCGQISLGHATFFGAGALTFRYLWLGGVSYYLALPAGALASLVLASAIGFPSFKMKGHYFSIGTLALAMIALITVQNLLPGVSFITEACLKEYSLMTIYYLALGVAALTVFAVYALSRSKLGLAMISVREDEDAAEAIGINTFKYKVAAMSISTVVAGFAGGIFAFYCGTYYHYAPFELGWSFDPLLIAFIGGAGTVAGPVIGSVVFVLLKELFAASLGQVNVLIFGIVFIVTVLFLPKGLVGIAGIVRKQKNAGRPLSSDERHA